MKKVYEAPSLEFEIIETEEIMDASWEEGGDFDLDGIVGGGEIEIDL